MINKRNLLHLVGYLRRCCNDARSHKRQVHRLLVLKCIDCWFMEYEIWVRVKEGDCTVGRSLTGQVQNFYLRCQSIHNKQRGLYPIRWIPPYLLRILIYRTGRVRSYSVHRVIVYSSSCWMSNQRVFCGSQDFETRCKCDMWGLPGCEDPSDFLFFGTNKMQYNIIQNTLHMRCQLLHVSAPTEFCWTYKIFAKYNQQDATFYNFFICVRRSTCFRPVLLPDAVCAVLSSWWWTENPSETCWASYRYK